MTMQTTTDNTLVIERILPADRETVYEAWTNPEVLLKWWGPQGVSIPTHELDVRARGKWSTTMYSEKTGEHAVSGEYISLDPPKGLKFTWAWTNPDGTRGHETEVEVTLESIASGTKMTMTQKIFDSVEQRDNHNFGWTSSFEKLDGVITEPISA